MVGAWYDQWEHIFLIKENRILGLIEGKDPSSSLYEKVIFPKHTWEVSVNASRKVVEGLQDCGIICHQSNGSYNSLTYHTGLSTCSFAKVCFVLLRITALTSAFSSLVFTRTCWMRQWRFTSILSTRRLSSKPPAVSSVFVPRQWLLLFEMFLSMAPGVSGLTGAVSAVGSVCRPGREPVTLLLLNTRAGRVWARRGRTPPAMEMTAVQVSHNPLLSPTLSYY